MSESVDLAQAQRPVPCDACEDEIPGTYYCIECKKTLCEECEKFHKKFTKDHSVVPRTKLGDIDTATLCCNEHGEQASFNCEKCNIPVCGKCVTGKHQAHKMIDLSDIIERKKKLLKRDLTEIQKNVLPKLLRQKDQIQCERDNYEEYVQKVIQDMETENQALHYELNRIHNERLRNLNISRESHLNMFDGYAKENGQKVDLLVETVNQYKNVIDKDNKQAIHSLASRRKPLPVVGVKADLPNPPSFLKGNIQEIEKCVGKLQLSSPSLKVKPNEVTTPIVVSKFQSPLKGRSAVCITKTGEVWLGGGDSRKLVVVDMNGKVKRKNKIHFRPTAIAALECGDIIVSPRGYDSRVVSRIFSSGKEQPIFDPQSCWSRGVSVTHDQKILICTVDGRVVKTNGDGTNVTLIYKGSGEDSAVHAVQCSNRNIYISDKANSSIVVVSEDGRKLETIKKTINGKELKWPVSLVVDKVDNILCADKDNNCIFIIDQSLQMEELLGRTFGIQQPRCLDIDNDNNLWITSYDGSLHVVKYLAK